MCTTNSAKELIVLAHGTQSYRLCTLTPLIASVTHWYLRAELRLRGILAKPPQLKDGSFRERFVYTGDNIHHFY